jgi:hypothetical protein
MATATEDPITLATVMGTDNLMQAIVQVMAMEDRM